MQQCTPLEAQTTQTKPDNNADGSIINSMQNGKSEPHHSHVSLPSTDQNTQEHSLEDVCKELHTKVIAFLKEGTEDRILRDVQEQTRIALGVIQEALAKYSIDQLCFSYNGGKDCLVLLIVYLVGLYAHLRPTAAVSTVGTGGAPHTTATNGGHKESLDSQNTTEHHLPPASTSEASSKLPSTGNSASPRNTAPPVFPTQLTSIYIQTPHPFPEVTSFVASSSAHYHLDLVASSLPMKEAFTEYLNEHKEVKAIFVGTRRTDPHGGSLTFFDETDRGWPKFMR